MESRLHAAGRRHRVAWFVGVVCLVLAVGLAVALGATGRRTTPGTPTAQPPTTPSARVLWTAPFSAESSQDAYLLGIWLTDGAIVQARPAGITAHDQRTGTVRWSIPGGTETRVCGMSRATEGGLGAIVTGGLGDPAYQGGPPERMCDRLSVIDIDTGMQVWTVEVGGAGSRPTDRSPVFPDITEGTVVLAGGGHLLGYELLTGALRWQLNRAQIDPPDRSGDGRCLVGDVFAADGSALVKLWCWGTPNELAALSVEAATGAIRWRCEIPPSVVQSANGAALVSAVPPVVSADRMGDGALVVLDGASGRVVTSKPIRADDPDSPLATFSDVRDRRQVRAVVAGDTLVAPTPGAPDSTTSADCEPGGGLAAVNLTTGETVWTRQDPDGCVRTLISADGETVLAMRHGGEQSAGQLIKIAVADGSVEPVADLPAGINTKGSGAVVRATERAVLVVGLQPWRDANAVVAIEL